MNFNYQIENAFREARETRYWLRLLRAGNVIEVPDDYFSEIDEINSILTSIVKTTSESLKKS